MKVGRIIESVILLALSTSPAGAYRVLVHPACPDMNPKVTWQDYLSAIFPRAANKVSGIAEVQFRKAKQVNDPKAIGNLTTRFCYNVQFHPDTKTYESWYTVPPGEQSSHNTKGGLPGDPSRNEINVYGIVLIFNSAGEVLNKNGETVGQLVCYLSNECGGY